MCTTSVCIFEAPITFGVDESAYRFSDENNIISVLIFQILYHCMNLSAVIGRNVCHSQIGDLRLEFGVN